jgi:hypothetical protein
MSDLRVKITIFVQLNVVLRNSFVYAIISRMTQGCLQCVHVFDFMYNFICDLHANRSCDLHVLTVEATVDTKLRTKSHSPAICMHIAHEIAGVNRPLDCTYARITILYISSYTHFFSLLAVLQVAHFKLVFTKCILNSTFDDIKNLK